MTNEEKELVFLRLNQMQEQIDGLEKKQNGLIKKLQKMLFKAIGRMAIN